MPADVETLVVGEARTPGAKQDDDRDPACEDDDAIAAGQAQGRPPGGRRWAPRMRGSGVVAKPKPPPVAMSTVPREEAPNEA